MIDIKNLENYFNAILEDGDVFPAQHNLLEEDARYEFYITLREKLTKTAASVAAVLPSIDKKKPQYFSILSKFNEVINQIIKLDDAALDVNLRNLAVNEIIKGKTPLPVGVLTDFVALLAENEATPLFANQYLTKLNDEKDEKIRQLAEHATRMVTAADLALFEAKSGIIAKDKKMLEVLRQFKMEEGKGIAQLAVEKFNIKPRDIKPKSKSHASRVGRNERGDKLV